MKKLIHIFCTLGMMVAAQFAIWFTTHRSEMAQVMYESVCKDYSANLMTDEELDAVWDSCRINIFSYGIACMMTIALTDPDQISIREYRWGTVTAILLMLPVVYLLPSVM